MNNRTKQILLKAMLAIVVIAAVLAVHRMDYQDEILMHQHACDMVKAGHWPASYCQGE